MKCPSGFVFQQTRATRPTQSDCRRSTKCRTCGGSWRSPQRSLAAVRTCLPVSHYTASAPSATGRRRQVVTLRVSGSVLACFLYKIYGIFRRCMYYIYNRKMVCSGMGKLLQIQHVTIVINHQVLQFSRFCITEMQDY